PAFDAYLQTDEYAVYLAAEIREYLKVPGLCTADVIKFRDKVLMKKALNGQVRAPRVYGSKDLFENRDLFPIVAKPRSYAGSKGVSILSSKEDLHEYLQANDVIMDDAIESFHEFSMNEVEFEEYVEGSIFHVDGLIFDNEIIFCRASQYLGKLLNYLKGEPVGSVSVGDRREQELWKEFVQQIHDVMRIPDGAFHLEAFLTNEGERVFLEIGARPGGGLIVSTIEKAIGLNLDEAHLQCQLGIIPIINDKSEVHYGWLMYPKEYYAESERRITEVRLPKAMPSSVMWSKVPEVGQSNTGSFSYINNLGSFVFVSEVNSQIYDDIEVLLRDYSVLW
ncbi:ATP-grasp domain-containing protein, partial [Alicyclobacillus acidoterrestris]